MEWCFGDLRQGRWLVTLGLLAQWLLTATNAAADAASAEQAGRATWDAAIAATVHGPSKIALRDQASLALPAGYGFMPPKEAAAVMKLMGNSTDSKFIGLIVPDDHQSKWLVSVDFDDAGYIKDDDAKDWDAKELLQSLKDGTEAGNEQRQAAGIPAIKVTAFLGRKAKEG